MPRSDVLEDVPQVRDATVAGTMLVTRTMPWVCPLCDKRRHQSLWCSSGHSVCAICTDVLVLGALRAKGIAA